MAVWLPVQCPHCHSTEVVKKVVLQKLFKDRAILTINSRYTATPKIPPVNYLLIVVKLRNLPIGARASVVRKGSV